MRIPKRLHGPIAFVLFAGFLALIWHPWKQDDRIPNSPPVEKLRVDGEGKRFSIVAPDGWRVSMNGEDLLVLFPKQSIPSRAKASIVVKLNDEMPTHWTDDGIRVVFAGRDAVRHIERRPGTFDDPARTSWVYYFQQNGVWVEVSYSIAASYDEIPPMALHYLETLEVADDLSYPTFGQESR